MPKKSNAVIHAKLVFKRACAAPVKTVFAAFADPAERERWGAPSENAAFFYEETDFRAGGRDVFRCGAKKKSTVSRNHDLLRHRSEPANCFKRDGRSRWRQAFCRPDDHDF